MPSRTQGLEEAERESRIGGGWQRECGCTVGRTGGRVGRRNRDAAREQREVFQSRDGSRPSQLIELSLRQAERVVRREISVATAAARSRRAIFPADRARDARARTTPPREPHLPFFPPGRARGILVEQPPVPIVAIAPSRDNAVMPRVLTRQADEPDGGRRVARS